MIKHKNKGFTLVEIIISIAVLSIVSVVFLQLFIKADQIQTKGMILDNETFLVSNLTEKLMAQSTVDGFIQVINPTIQNSQEDEQIKLDFFYDDSLQPLDKEGTNYHLEMNLEKKESRKTGDLYLVTVIATHPKNDKPVKISTYFYELKNKTKN